VHHASWCCELVLLEVRAGAASWRCALELELGSHELEPRPRAGSGAGSRELEATIWSHKLECELVLRADAVSWCCELEVRAGAGA